MLINGFWKIDVAQYNNGETFFEEGKGLVYADLFKQEGRKPLYAFLIAQAFNVVLTLGIAYVLFAS